MVARRDAGVGGHCHTDGADEINGYIVFVYGDWWWCFHGWRQQLKLRRSNMVVFFGGGCLCSLFMTLAAKESGGKSSVLIPT